VGTVRHAWETVPHLVYEEPRRPESTVCGLPERLPTSWRDGPDCTTCLACEEVAAVDVAAILDSHAAEAVATLAEAIALCESDGGCRATGALRRLRENGFGERAAHAEKEEKVRPAFEQIFMALALRLSERSTCSRLQVGCVITSADFRKVISIGYNGGAAGLDETHDCASLESGKCLHLHAEENAIINCDVPRGTPKIVFSTNLPCPMCCRRLINLGHVRTLYYLRGYRDDGGVELLEKTGVGVVEWAPRLDGSPTAE
jgi:dCMP deaminase